MINLNDNSLLENQGVAIFNGGNAGRVKNVAVTIEPKDKNDMSKSPDAKIFFDDGNGKINIGFYHFEKTDRFDEETNAKMAKDRIIMLLSIAKNLAPTDFQFPDVSGKSQKEIEIVLLNVIKKYENEKVNIFASYGTKNKPKMFLEPRKYNFIERAETPEADTKLTVKTTDLLERPMANDNLASQFTGTVTGGSPKGSETEGSFWG